MEMSSGAAGAPGAEADGSGRAGPGQIEMASVDLPVDEGAACRARRVLADVLAAWQVTDEDLIYDAQLALTELVSNAFRHGAGEIGMELERQGDTIVVAVRDGSAVLPRLHQAAPDAEGGRGLAILSAVAQDWGVDSHGGGKRVWARLQPRHRPPEPPAASQP